MNSPEPDLASLPDIPERRYFTIGEVSEMCGVKPHVLRYWEQEFPLLSPSKRRGNRRYYLRDHIHLILKIKQLLYEEGFTISGARQKLYCHKEKRNPQVSSGQVCSSNPAELIRDMKTELEELLELLT